MACISSIYLLPYSWLVLLISLANHVLNIIFICFSDCVLVADKDLKLVWSATSSRRDVTVLQTLNSIFKYSVILSILYIFPLYFLQISGSHVQLLPLLSKLLLVFVAKFSDFFLEVYLLLIACRVQLMGLAVVKVVTCSQATHSPDILDDILGALVRYWPFKLCSLSLGLV